MPINRKTQKSGLDAAIDNLLLELDQYPGYDDDYAKRVEQLDKLYAIKRSSEPEGIDRNTLLIVGGNIAIALILIGFEQQHVITTKALGFLSKVR